MRNDFETGYFEHSALGTTWKKKAAKYISRVWKNGRWVYEYKITGQGYKRDAEIASKHKNSFKDKANALKNKYRGQKKQESKEKKRLQIYKEANPNRHAAEQGYYDEMKYQAAKQTYNKDKSWKNGINYLYRDAVKQVNQAKIENANARKEERIAKQENKIKQVNANASKTYNSYTKEKQNEQYFANKEKEANEGYEKSLAGQIAKGQKAIHSLLVSEKKEHITDTFTGKTRPVNRSGETINIKELSDKNKKKKK